MRRNIITVALLFCFVLSGCGLVYTIENSDGNQLYTNASIKNTDAFGTLSEDALSFEYTDENYDIKATYNSESNLVLCDIKNKSDADIGIEINTIAINGICFPNTFQASTVYANTSYSLKVGLSEWPFLINDKLMNSYDVKSISFFINIFKSYKMTTVHVEGLVGSTPDNSPKGDLFFSDNNIDLYVYSEGKAWSETEFWAYNKSDKQLSIGSVVRIINGKTMPTNAIWLDRDMVILPQTCGDTGLDNTMDFLFENDLAEVGIKEIDSFSGDISVSSPDNSINYRTDIIEIIK